MKVVVSEGERSCPSLLWNKLCFSNTSRTWKQAELSETSVDEFVCISSAHVTPTKKMLTICDLLLLEVATGMAEHVFGRVK